MRKEGKGIYTPMVIILSALVLISIALTSTFLARFITGKDNNDGAVVATFDVSASSEFTQNLDLANIYPGQEKSWSFVVTSNSEVSVKCSAKIVTTGNLPLTFVFKCDSTVVSADEVCTFVHGGATSHTITVVAQWLTTEANQNEQYAGRVEIVTFTLVAEQID